MSEMSDVPVLTEDEVRIAFRFAFHREPRDIDVAWHRRHRSFDAMRDVFLETPRFYQANNVRKASHLQDYAVQLPDGLIVWIPYDDLYVGPAVASNRWEQPETALMSNTLRPGSSMIDIGAMIGWFTLKAATIVGAGGAVYSFEPQPRIHQLLRLSVIANRFENFVNTYELALSDRNMILSLWQDLPVSGELGSNLGHTWIDQGSLSPDASLQPRNVSASTRAVRLDDLELTRKIDFVKIDVEGAEPLALQGAEKTIRRSHPVILCELFPDQLENVGKSSPQALIDMITSWGYSPYALNSDGTLRAWNSSDIPVGRGEYTSIVFQ